jgi:hypothetical protein
MAPSSAASAISSSVTRPVRSSFVTLTTTFTDSDAPEVVTSLLAKRVFEVRPNPSDTEASAAPVKPRARSAFFRHSFSVGSMGHSVRRTLMPRNRVGEQPWLIALLWPG